MWYEKLSKYFKEKKISNKELSRILGYSETMISRYLKGISKINAEFIAVLIKNFPEIDLQYIFADDSSDSNILNEPREKYATTILGDIREIEAKLQIIKEKLSTKGE